MVAAASLNAARREGGTAVGGRVEGRLKARDGALAVGREDAGGGPEGEEPAASLCAAGGRGGGAGFWRGGSADRLGGE